MKQNRQLRRIYTALCATIIVCGSQRLSHAFQAGDKAEATQNYDAALEQSNKAHKKHPKDPQYELKVYRMRFEASPTRGLGAGSRGAIGLRGGRRCGRKVSGALAAVLGFGLPLE